MFYSASSSSDDLCEDTPCDDQAEANQPSPEVCQLECPPHAVLKLNELINGIKYIHPGKAKLDQKKPPPVKTAAVLATENILAYYRKARKQYLEFLGMLWKQIPYKIDLSKSDAEVNIVTFHNS